MSTQRTSARRTRPRVVLRDVASFVLGWGLIYQQAVFVDPAKVNETFIWAALVLLGVPGSLELLARLGGGQQLSAAPPSASLPDSSSPVISSGGGE